MVSTNYDRHEGYLTGGITPVASSKIAPSILLFPAPLIGSTSAAFHLIVAPSCWYRYRNQLTSNYQHSKIHSSSFNRKICRVHFPNHLKLLAFRTHLLASIISNRQNGYAVEGITPAASAKVAL